MSEHQVEKGEEAIDESGRNLTQRRLDEDGIEQKPVDAEWDGRGTRPPGAALGKDDPKEATRDE